MCITVAGTDCKSARTIESKSARTGNKFVIEIESTLYTCTSCQKFLQAAKIYANSENKILEIKFIAHRDAIRMDNVKNMINE
ncbi:hypothetical protein ASE40_21625 [Flavobacterium sp. Root935]|nr:hypothetical protein ASE40_21625 [Flavobacterium sp. Root935]